jgi:MSHA biogenesis protein MshJ
MRLPAEIQAYVERIDAMTLRERALIFLACAALVVWAFSSLLQPVLVERTSLSRIRDQQREEMRAWNLQIEALARAKAAGISGEKRARLLELQKRVATLFQQIEDRHRELVPPERMSALLSDMLRRSRGLQLVSLTTLPPDVIAPAPGDAKSAQMYRHGIDMTVSGAYLDLVSYLNALEHMPVKVFWGGMQLSAAYPVATLRISLFTFSPEKTWLAL